MTDVSNARDDAALRAMWRGTIQPVADTGFSKAVYARVRRDIRIRLVVLLSTAALGLFVAVRAMPQFVTVLSDKLAGLASRLAQADVANGLYGGLSIPSWLQRASSAREALTSAGVQLTSVPLNDPILLYVFAALAASVSLVVVRVLER